MAFCGKCGSEIGNDNVFCPKCGALQEQATGAGPESSQQPGQPYMANPQPSQQPYQQYTPQPSQSYNQQNNTSYQSQKLVDNTGILIWSILTALFCCMPLGIVGIVFSIQANKETSFEGAQNKLKNAKLMCIIGTVAGVLALIVSFATGFIEAFF